MKRRQTGYFMDFGDDRDPRSYEARARLHQHHRERAVASILVELHVMAVKKVLPQKQNWLVSAERAHWQDFSGSAEKGTQAAHCVPCQIRISGKLPEQYVRKHSGNRADIIAAYFGKTDKFLPAVFNQCDSKAEQDGLRDAFHDACLDVLNSGFHGDDQATNVTVNVRNAFSIFKSGSRNAFQATYRYFESSRNSYERISRTDKAREEALKMRIVGHYLKELNYSSAIADIARLGEIRELISEYNVFMA
jgi:hypothetical protein